MCVFVSVSVTQLIKLRSILLKKKKKRKEKTREIQLTIQNVFKLNDDIICIQLIYTYPTVEQGL